MLLDVSRDGVKVAAARIAREHRPGGKGSVGGLDRAVDVLGATLRKASERAAARWILAFEIIVSRGLDESAADEVTQLAAVLCEPGERMFFRLRRRTVVHGLEDVLDAGGCQSRFLQAEA